MATPLKHPPFRPYEYLVGENPYSGSALSREEKILKIKGDLRRHVRSMTTCDVFSLEWFKVSESVVQVAKIARMEMNYATSNVDISHAGRNDNGTLWDQERDELAVRILLEEGKLNLMLRIVHDFKTMHYTGNVQKKIHDIPAQTGISHNTAVESISEFEVSLGMLLKLAFAHVEALQTLDIPLLLQHCKLVMAGCLTLREMKFGADKQECLVLKYLSDLTAAQEEIDEDRIMDLVEEHEMLPTSLLLLEDKHKDIPEFFVGCLLQFMSNIINSEAFSTDPDRFWTKDEYKIKLLRLKDVIEKYGEDSMLKRKIRPVLDQIRRFRRQFPTETTPKEGGERSTSSAESKDQN